jgi:AraC-like DNA-binding protein
VAVVVDTTEVPPAERFDLWAQVSAQVFEPLAVSQSAQGPFSARLEHHGLGPVGLFHMWADASAADRTVSLIRSGDPELMEIMLQLDGECSITQDGRSSHIRPGELTSWHSSKPYCVAGRTSFEAVMVYMPVVLLRPHVDRVLRRTAMGIDGETGVGAIVRQYVRGLLGGLQDGSLADASRAHLAEGLLDLVRALLVGPEREAAPSSTDALRTQISEHIDANLSDPGLGPASIASEHFISRSYLYRLFADEGPSVSETIRGRRLERARRDLADPALAHETIFDVASRWGFVSKSHFSRAFRAAFRQSPSDFRRDTLGSGPLTTT